MCSGVEAERAGLYLHVPFCRSKCAYCDFYSRPGFDDEVLDRFAAAMQRDICRAAALYGDYCFDSVFVGGGTPTVLGARLADILQTAYSRLTFAADCEITVEANPESISPQLAALLAANGVNRISLGAQSMDDVQLRLLGRIHSADTVAEAVEAVRKSGIARLNLDLMFGLPYQRGDGEAQLAVWESTLHAVLALGPDHLSAYSLKIEPGTPLCRRAGEYEFPDEELEERMYGVLCERADMYLWTETYLARQGYEQYEISNFAKPGCECRHNLKYWTGKPYLGLGPAAHSYIRARRMSVAPDTDAYIAGKAGVIDCGEIDAAERAYEHIVTSLRLSRGIDFIKLQTYYDLNRIRAMADDLVSHGLARRTPQGLALTERGFRVSNAVIALLDGARPQDHQ